MTGLGVELGFEVPPAGLVLGQAHGPAGEQAGLLGRELGGPVGVQDVLQPAADLGQVGGVHGPRHRQQIGLGGGHRRLVDLVREGVQQPDHHGGVVGGDQPCGQVFPDPEVAVADRPGHSNGAHRGPGTFQAVPPQPRRGG